MLEFIESFMNSCNTYIHLNSLAKFVSYVLVTDMNLTTKYELGINCTKKGMPFNSLIVKLNTTWREYRKNAIDCSQYRVFEYMSLSC